MLVNSTIFLNVIFFIYLSNKDCLLIKVMLIPMFCSHGYTLIYGRLSFNKSDTHSNVLFQLVHIDLWGHIDNPQLMEHGIC